MEDFSLRPDLAHGGCSESQIQRRLAVTQVARIANTKVGNMANQPTSARPAVMSADAIDARLKSNDPDELRFEY